MSKHVLETIYFSRHSSPTCHIVSKQFDYGWSNVYCRLDNHSRGDQLSSLLKEVPDGKKICKTCAKEHKKKMDRIKEKVEEFQISIGDGLFGE